jgi:hypothetical protein
MRTSSISLYELGSVLDRLTVITSTYAGVIHIISGRHPDLGRITVVQGMTDILIITEDRLAGALPEHPEIVIEAPYDAPVMQQAA